MPRGARIVVEGMPHHVTQRGNYKQDVFESTKDFQNYCYSIQEYAQKYNVDILAYCLMRNHVHFIVIPQSGDGLASLFKMVHMKYSLYKHKQKALTGHLWQGRFFSSVLDDVHLVRAVRYVEQNPVRAQIVKTPWDYIWSSARFHIGLENNPIIKTVGKEKMLLLGDQRNWRAYLGHNDQPMVALIREQTKKGGVIAAEHNISFFERMLGMNLKVKRMGRPKIGVCP